MSDKKVIEVENVSFAYGQENDVLRNVSFSINKGTISMLIGPNGSGKTTLLKIMIGLLEPTTGKITVLDKPPQSIINKVGYVPQKITIDSTFPIAVIEFLQFSHPELSKDKILKELKHLGVENLADKLIGSLSGGQMQRVLIVRALLGKPEILFLDEPVSGIDIGGEQNFYEVIREIKTKYNVTVIMVSHEVQIVSSIADQVICINKEMLCSGKPEQALTPEIIGKLYGENMSQYHHHC